MNLVRVTENDLYGRVSLKVQGGQPFSGYYASLEAIRPLVTSQQWRNDVSGFYINVTGNFDAVRISYFTSSPESVQQLIAAFVKRQGLDHAPPPADSTLVPGVTRVSHQNGGEELRFRQFLSTYTLIGLEIMQADLQNARCLLATFRWRVMLARQQYKPHFLKTFEQQTPFYNSLSQADKEQFWQDLAHWPNPPQYDWAHFFVNMVLAADWPIHFFLSPQQPLSIAEVNNRIMELGFQIPANWVLN